MKTIATLNQLNRQSHLAARRLLELCLLSACLLLAWKGANWMAGIPSSQNPATARAAGENAPYDLAHDANYRATIMLYTAQNSRHDFPF